jgi:PEP-CTERM motif
VQFTSGPSSLLLLAAVLAAPGSAGALDFNGTRSNISPGGTFGGRCGDSALTISFGPGAFAASGSTNLGNFVYTASHCIDGPPPGAYYNGLFAWDFGDGVLNGTYHGLLEATSTPGQFALSETLAFTGGSGRFAGASGGASAAGILLFGTYDSGFASYGATAFRGSLDVPAIPEPGTVALWAAGGLALAGVAVRRRRNAPED